MKRILALLLGIALLAGVSGGAWAESGEPSAEWTVMIYLCGTDLESDRYHSASGNLRSIAKAIPVDSVNVVIETGGTSEWYPAEELGMEIANDRLQRWTYGQGGFTLVDEQPEACMSHAETLSEFIRWTAENYPAKKNLLLLWDHGGGSCSGMICDENYGMTIMPVYSLERALKDGGTHFDLVLTDACLMASLEVAQALAPCADYLAASEEIMAGNGTNYEKWLQYLYDRPDCTGGQIGKQICDLTSQYYVEQEDDATVSMFTMSLIDLKKIGAVAEAYDAFMREAAGLTKDPEAFCRYAMATWYVDNYMQPEMCDMFDLTRRAETAGIPTKVTHAVQDAVEDAVVYFLRSPNHIYSHGLSVWYTLNAAGKTLDHFARTCRNPEQLAFLDAVSLDWEAPDWVYEKAERQPHLNRMDYVVGQQVSLTEDGTEAYMTIESGEPASVCVSYELMYMDDKTGICYMLGESGDIEPVTDEATGKERYFLCFDGCWPTLAGVPLGISMVDDTETFALFDVGVRINDRDYLDRLRLVRNYEKTVVGEDGKETEKPDYELKGVWDGFDTHTGLPGRNICSLNEYAGASMKLYRLVYSDELERVSAHIEEKETVITADMKVTREPLPKGQYLYRFVVRDVFGNIIRSGDPKPVNWDGKKVSFPEEKPEGQ